MLLNALKKSPLKLSWWRSLLPSEDTALPLFVKGQGTLEFVSGPLLMGRTKKANILEPEFSHKMRVILLKKSL